MNKAALRNHIRTLKRSLSEDQIIIAGEQLKDLVLSSEMYRQAQTIYGYIPFNQEVRTVPILEQALSDGKQVAVPKVFGDCIRFIYMDDLSMVEKGFSGIPEPIMDGPVANDPTALVLVPGLAFDQDGNRLGYGGGFYDKFLANEPNHPTIALCYAFQMVDHIPADEYDVPVDFVFWV